MIQLDHNNIAEYGYFEAGQVSTASPLVNQVEKVWSDRLGMAVAATNSGTSALHLALIASGVGLGDEVILPALTYIATLNVIRYCGATPVFVDVDPETWCIDEDKAINAITPKTKAIIPVHLYGNISPICEGRGVTIIEDACQALGSTYLCCGVKKDNPFLSDLPAGTIGDLGCFSFNGNKIITAGGGGFVVGDEERIKHIRSLCDPGADLGETRYNYRMTGLSAALLLAQTERFEEFLAKKILFNEIYRHELGDIIEFQKATPGSDPNWWYTAGLMPDEIDVDVLRFQLSQRGLETRRIFYPLQRFAWLYPVTWGIYNRGLCLPTSTCNEENDIFKACKIIREEL